MGGHAMGHGSFQPGFRPGVNRSPRIIVRVGGFGVGGWRWPGGGAAYYSPDNSYVYDDGYPPTDVADEVDDGTLVYPAVVGNADGQAGGVARVTVHVPADATVWFNGARMLAGGETRTFATPPLKPDQDYHYAVKVRWTEAGRPVTRAQNLDIRAGKTYTLDFTGGR
jgi:uncharacterized protein (TIGR03000 family)